VITLVGQEYKSTEGRHDYKTEIETIYGGWGLLINIGKSKENFKDRKPKCFNYNSYEYIAKDCWKPKKDKGNRKCYKCEQVGHIAKDCRTKQKMKNQNIQKDIETDTEEEDKKKSFREDPE